MNNEVIESNSRIEVLILVDGQLTTKAVRVLSSVKKYIFEKMISKRYTVAQYQIL